MADKLTPTQSHVLDILSYGPHDTAALRRKAGATGQTLRHLSFRGLIEERTEYDVWWLPDNSEVQRG